MPKYRFSGEYKVVREKQKVASEPMEIMSFDAATDAIARVKVVQFRESHQPIVNAKLVRVEETPVEIADTEGYEFLPWHDCECGCQCSTITLGSLHFAAYSRTIDGFDLDYGSRWNGGRLGHFKTFADLDREVRRLAKPQVAKDLAATSRAAESLGVATA